METLVDNVNYFDFTHSNYHINGYTIISSFQKKNSNLSGLIRMKHTSSYRLERFELEMPDNISILNNNGIDVVSNIDKQFPLLLDYPQQTKGIIHYEFNVLSENNIEILEINPKYAIVFNSIDDGQNYISKYQSRFNIINSYKLFISVMNQGLLFALSRKGENASTIILTMTNTDQDLVGFVNFEEYFANTYAINKIFPEITIREKFNNKFKRKYLCVKFQHDINKEYKNKNVTYLISKENNSDKYNIKVLGELIKF